jgi:hypothetical protein
VYKFLVLLVTVIAALAPGHCLASGAIAKWIAEVGGAGRAHELLVARGILSQPQVATRLSALNAQTPAQIMAAAQTDAHLARLMTPHLCSQAPDAAHMKQLLQLPIPPPPSPAREAGDPSQFVRRLAQTDWQGLDGTWLTRPRDADFTTRAIARTLSRTGGSPHLLDLVYATPPADDQALLILELALYEPQMWTAYVHQTLARGASRDVLDDVLEPLLRGMPSDLKTSYRF